MKVYLVLGFKLTTFQTWAAYFSRIIKARIKKQPNFSKSRNYLKSYIFTKKAQIVTNFWVSTFVRKFHTRRGPLKNCQIWSHCLRPIHITVFDLCICGRLLRFHKDTFHNPQSTAENADCVASSVNHPLWIGIEVVTTVLTCPESRSDNFNQRLVMVSWTLAPAFSMHGASLSIRATFLSGLRCLSTVLRPEASQTRWMHSLEQTRLCIEDTILVLILVIVLVLLYLKLPNEALLHNITIS